MVMRTWRGKLIVQAWPKPRGKKASPAQREQQERFANANFLAKFAPGELQQSAIRLGSKGPLYPRDYLVSSMFGGIWIFHLPDGRRVYPMSLVKDMTRDLDIIAQMPGMLMARDELVWAPVQPTADGQVLYWPDKDAVPVPVSPGPEIGGHYLTSMPIGSANTQAWAGKFNIFTANKNCTIVAMWPLHLGIVNATYQGHIFRIDGYTTKELLGSTIEFERTIANSRRDRHPLNTPVRLNQGTKYACGFVRTDSTTTAQNNVWADTRDTYGGYPAAVDMQYANFPLNDASLEVTALDFGSSAFFTIDLEIRM